jgi:hypothetical protein
VAAKRTSSKKKPPVWCEIIFKDACGPKYFEDVRRMYSKGGLFCVELPKRDKWGRPIIAKYPIMNIFEVLSPHPDHPSATAR